MRVLKTLWAVWFGINFAVFFLLLYPLFRYYLADKRRYPKAHKLRSVWGSIIMFMCGLRGKIEYEEPLDPEGTYIFVANHSSYLDILSLNVMLPQFFNFMAKEELGRIPLFGIFFRTIDIAVNRRSIKASHQAFLRAGEQLKQGEGIAVFPEGTIHHQAPVLSKFKPGAFKLAIDSGVEIVPISIIDNWKRFPDKKGFIGTPGKMRMYVHRAIKTAHLKPEDAEALKQNVFAIIEHKLKQYDHINRVYESNR